MEKMKMPSMTRQMMQSLTTAIMLKRMTAPLRTKTKDRRKMTREMVKAALKTKGKAKVKALTARMRQRVKTLPAQTQWKKTFLVIAVPKPLSASLTSQ